MSEADFTTLGAPRHRCYGCGKCCYGHNVALLDDEEVARIEKHGAALEVPDPVVDGTLRFEQGQCVFLGEDLLCTIHAKYGFAEKPLRCQAWPLKAIKTEGELRFAVDPGCTNTWRSWKDGDVQEAPDTMVLRKGVVGQQERGIELSILRRSLEPGATVASVAQLLCGNAHPSPTAELPEGFAQRVVTRVQATRFRQFLSKEELGWGIRSSLEHMPDAIDSWDRTAPPAFDQLTPEQDAFALDVFRRKLYLREAPLPPKVLGDALLTMAGILACAWADPTPEVFGPALSTWTRILRFQAFWLRLAPEPQILRWIATGQYDGELSPDVVIGGKANA